MVAEPRRSLPKAARVRKRSEYQRLQREGQRVTLAHFVLIVSVRDQPNAAGPRLGVTASRRVGNAVRRNRGKRLVREAFRQARELFPDDVDVVVVVKAQAANLGLEEVLAEWRSARGALGRRIEAARRARRASTEAS